MEISLITVGKTKFPFIIAGINEYIGRIRRYLHFSLLEIADIKSTRTLSEEIQKQREGENILRQVHPGDIMILLDEKGKEYTSFEFSNYVEKLLVSGRKRILFVVGGPYGFSEDVYSRADAKLSLSRMTFNHEMVRLFFIEQVYRAMTILRNEPYHHE